MQQRSLAVLGATLLLAISVACQKSTPATPAAPTAPGVTPSDGSTLKASAPTPQSPVGDIRIETFTNPTLTAGSSTFTQGGTGTLQYRFQVFNDANAMIEDSGLRSSPSWTSTFAMDFDKRYTWWTRAESGGAPGPWSTKASFLSPNGGFIRGQQVFDPMTNGKSVGLVVGGHFVTGANGGWQSDTLYDGVSYDIPTCQACKAEFDVTNFGGGEGSSISVDVKWFSMGDASAFDGGFLAFRDHPWKMHLEQRSDGDGTGMQLIWRNGAGDNDTGGDPEYGDHRGKFLSGGPEWGHSFDNKVWHFIIEWTSGTYKISIQENGGPAKQWFPGIGGDSGFFNAGHPYTPANHRIQLGCIPRGESMIGARYRNFKLTPQ